MLWIAQKPIESRRPILNDVLRSVKLQLIVIGPLMLFSNRLLIFQSTTFSSRLSTFKIPVRVSKALSCKHHRPQERDVCTQVKRIVEKSLSREGAVEITYNPLHSELVRSATRAWLPIVIKEVVASKSSWGNREQARYEKFTSIRTFMHTIRGV